MASATLSAGAISFTPFTPGAPMVPVSDAGRGGLWIPGAHIPQPHIYEQGYEQQGGLGGSYAQDAQDAQDGHDAADAFAHEHEQQQHHGHRNGNHGRQQRRWSQPNPQYAQQQLGQHVAAPSQGQGQMYDINMYAHGQHPGQMQYHFSPPSSPPNTPTIQVHTPPPMSLSSQSQSKSRRTSHSAPPARRHSSPDLGRKATAPTGQRIYLLPKVVNSDLVHHGVQLDYDM